MAGACGHRRTEGLLTVRRLNRLRNQPYCIRPRDGALFSFAGLWETWNDPKGETVETCTILTTEANELMRPLHDRMPVILDAGGEALWLDQTATADALRSLFMPFPADQMEALPVNPWVSNARNEGPRCLELIDVSGTILAPPR